MTAIQDIKPPVPQQLEGVDWEALWPESQRHLVDWWVRVTTYATELESVPEKPVLRERYREYLQTLEWRQRRDATLRYYQDKCAWHCGRRATQVHHFKHAYRRLGRERVGDLVALCPACHERHHEGLVALDNSVPPYREIVGVWSRLPQLVRAEIHKACSTTYGTTIIVR